MNPHDASSDTYDRGIVPAETAARKEREGDAYKQTPSASSKDGIDTTGGYTVSSEGLINNFAIEPEMYVETPGDLRQEEAAATEARAQEMHEVNQTDEQGKLTVDGDERGKGVGII
ncbi:MAG: hypothetical protein AAF327_00500 [Cyanobacteria bacterium P01_A01_bin.37]